MDTDEERDAPRPPPPEFDARRFDAVYRETSAFVLRSLRRLVADEAVDDAFQDVYLVVARRLGEFEGRSKLSTWVYGIVLRVAADHRRSHARRQRRMSAAGNEPAPEPPETPEQAARLSEGRRLLHRILDAMEDPLREVFVLVELEQVAGPEVAALLELNPNTMHSRLRSARARFEELRVALTEGGS